MAFLEPSQTVVCAGLVAPVERAARMQRILGVRVPEVRGLVFRSSDVRMAMPRKGRPGGDGRKRALTYEYVRYGSWAEAVKETGLTMAKLRWEIEKFLKKERA